MSPRIIFVGERQDLCQSLRRVAVGAGHEFAVARTFQEAVRWADPARPPIIFAEKGGEPDLEPQADVDTGLLRRVVWIVREDVDTFVGQLKNHPWVGHVTSGADGVDPVELMATAQKILRNEIFGLDKYLSWGATIRESRIAHSDDRFGVTEECRQYAMQLGVDARRVKNFCRVVDELTQNAVFHAPRGPDGTAIHRLTPRTASFPLPGGREVSVHYGCNGRHLGLSVQDAWGSLDPQLLVSRLEDGVRGHAMASEAYPGAGIGLYVCLRTLNQLVVNVNPGLSTEMIGLLDVATVFAEHRRKRRSFNIFVQSAAVTGP